jgi:16S rRNA (guanine527-N7)-methyltransferase
VSSALQSLAAGAAPILGRPLTEAELAAFDKYLQLLLKWQKTQRLVGSSDESWIVENLFLDSLLFLKVFPDTVTSLADVGSGAGVPGIPLKIVRPSIRVTLIESRARRASFLSAAIRELGLRDARVVTARVERYVGESSAAFDVAVMRCAGDFAELARIASGLVRVGGAVIAAGPPVRKALPGVEWMEVRGVRGQPRLFGVYRRGKALPCEPWNK